jgi:ribosome modulation factor
MTSPSRSSSLETIYQQGYSKGLSGGSKEACPAHIRYAKETFSAWLEGWKAGRLEGNHPIPKPWISVVFTALVLGLLMWALTVWLSGDDTPTVASAQTAANSSPAPSQSSIQPSFGFASTPNVIDPSWLAPTAKDVAMLYFIAKVEHKAGQTLTHTWYRDGQQVGEVGFDIQSARFNSVSQRAVFTPSQATWRVTVSDSLGQVLADQTVVLNP